ncbi:MAG: GDP-mannose 4,6-dehydratase [Acidimicrobiia bacterium]|nr:GDP-mannose 4,6-dehydratase [Acidimicrobiia bacterium]
MKAVVTGGAGFIGSTLVDQLIGRGDEVIVLDDLSSGRKANLESATAEASGRLQLELGDICDDATTELIAGARPDVVFHMAAQADVRVSVADPVLDARINLLGTLRVLEGARLGGGAKVVFAASGGTLYGEPDPSALPLRETQARNPGSPYGVSKMSGIDYLACYDRLHGVPYTALALANVFGPRQDPHGEAGVVAIFAGKLLAGEPCTVFGTGEQTRDFVYVDDVARAFVLAADAGTGVINIGTGVETSVNHLYQVMAEAAGGPTEPERATARPGELDRSALDNTLALEQLGWAPEVDLEAGMRAVIDWSRRRD